MEIYELTEIENIQNFILGGRADFIACEKDNDNHINFLVEKDRKDDTLYFVRYKSLDWKYIGLIRVKLVLQGNDNYSVPIFYPIKLDKNPTQEQLDKAEIFRKLILYIYYIWRLPCNMKITYGGICSVCKRRLTDPAYIRIGIGPICLKK